MVPLMAHSKPGVSLDAVSAELQAITERFAKRNPDAYPKEFKIHAQSLNDFLLGKFAGTLLILMVAVGFLGSAQEFDGTRILGCFPESHEFGSCRRDPLRFEQEVAEVFIPTATA
jgi:hypothetical protein